MLIFLLVLLIFGGKKIPEVAKGLGKGIREFKKAKDEITDSFQDAINDDGTPSVKTEETEGSKSDKADKKKNGKKKGEKGSKKK